MKVGLFLEGGGMRCAYIGGALRALADLGIRHFHCIVSTSASSFNAPYFVSGQYTEIVNIWKNLVIKNELIGLPVHWQYGKIYNIERLVHQVFVREVPLDFKKVRLAKTKIFFGVTNFQTKKLEFLSTTDYHTLWEMMIASAANFFVYPPKVRIGSQEYFDAIYSHPFPFQKLLEEGCEKIVVIRSKREFQATASGLLNFFSLSPYQLDSQKINTLYQEAKNLLSALQRQKMVLLVEPQKIISRVNFTKSIRRVRRWVNLGYQDCLETFKNNQDFLKIKDAKEFPVFPLDNPKDF